MFPTTPLHNLVYHAPRQGSVWMELDLRLDPNPIVQFWDDKLQTMPLHIEFRRAEALVVINRYTAKGWSSELLRALPPTAAPHRLGLTFRS